MYSVWTAATGSAGAEGIDKIRGAIAEERRGLFHDWRKGAHWLT